MSSCGLREKEVIRKSEPRGAIARAADEGVFSGGVRFVGVSLYGAVGFFEGFDGSTEVTANDDGFFCLPNSTVFGLDG